MSAWLLEPFIQFGFMQNALLGCALVCLGAVPVGVFMTLRRMSLTGDAMAHAILPGVALAYCFTGFSLVGLTLGGLSAGLLVALAAGWLARSGRQQEDSSLAALYLIALAGGVIVLSVKGNRIDLFHVLFGSVLALDSRALMLLASMSVFSLLLLCWIFRALVLESLDPFFSGGAAARRGALAHYGFLVLMVLNLVAGFQALGTLMAVAIMILPAASARACTDSLRHLLVLAVFLALVASYLGLLLSYHAALPAGPAIVMVLGVMYLGCLLVAQLRRGGKMLQEWSAQA